MHLPSWSSRRFACSRAASSLVLNHQFLYLEGSRDIFWNCWKKQRRVKCQKLSGTVVAEAAECGSLSFSASLGVSAGQSALGTLAGALRGRALQMLCAPSAGVVGHCRSQRGKILILPLLP